MHGCGIGWYASHPESGLVDESGLSSYERPAVYTTTSAPSHDRNLRSLAKMVETGLLFGHVRAAGPGASVHQYNCHPFTCGRFLFMHNGDIANFRAIRRSLLSRLRDSLFDWLSGTTDSELLFALFLNQLPDSDAPTRRYSADVLAAALRATLQLVVDASGGAPSSLNVAVTDGEMVLATRFRNGPGEVPPSLYYHTGYLHGAAWDLDASPGLGGMTGGMTQDGLLTERDDDGVALTGAPSACDGVPSRRGSLERRKPHPRQSLLVSSEPLTEGGEVLDAWRVFPPNTMLVAAPVWGAGEQEGRPATRSQLCESSDAAESDSVLIDLRFESLEQLAATPKVTPHVGLVRRNSWTEARGASCRIERTESGGNPPRAALPPRPCSSMSAAQL